MKWSDVYTYVENHECDSCKQTDPLREWRDSNSTISIVINDVFGFFSKIVATLDKVPNEIKYHLPLNLHGNYIPGKNQLILKLCKNTLSL